MTDKPRRLRLSALAALTGLTLVPVVVTTAANAEPATTRPGVESVQAAGVSGPARGLHVTVTPWGEPTSFRASSRLLVHDMPANRGGKTRATALLFVPEGRKPAGGWPIVAWAHGTSTPGDRECAPSLTPDDLDGGLTRDGFTSDYAFQIGQFLTAGYAVVAPDLEGLGPNATVTYPYLSKASSARSLLYGVRAAREADASLSNRYAVVGHSDGGRAVLGVEAYANEAPELKLTGTVASVPFGSLEKQVTEFDRQAQTGTGPAAAVGATNAQFNVALVATAIKAQSPSFDASAIMGDDLLKLLPTFQTLCSVDAINLIDTAVKAKPNGTFAGYKPGWARDAQVRSFLAANDQTADPAFTLRRPTLIVQGTADSFVLSSFQSEFVARLKRAGAPITYRVYPGDDHFSIIRHADADVLSFLDDLLRR